MTFNGWRCVLCATPLPSSSGTQTCPRCQEVYPRVGDVGVFLPSAAAVIGACCESARAEHVDLKKRLSAPITAFAMSAETIAARMAKVSQAEELTLTTIKDISAPLAEYQRSHPPAGGLADAVVGNYVGWSIRNMLPYVYVDWADTSAYKQVEALVIDSVRRHCRETEAAVILGSGACGLVRALAEQFSVTLGVDLSIQTLLMARQLLDGKQASFALKEASYSHVTVKGTVVPREKADLVVADVAALPFADASVSLIVSQYLLDILPACELGAREIARVLKPGGVWLNFSLPFKLRGDPSILGARTETEMAAFVSAFGCDLLESERVSYPFLDLTKLDRFATGQRQGVVYFAARKTEAHVSDASSTALQSYFAGSSLEVWQSIPALAAGASVEVVSGESFSRAGGKPQAMFGTFGGTPRVVDPKFLSMVKLLLSTLDGKTSMTHALGKISAASGRTEQERDFALVLWSLKNMGLLQLEDA